MDVPTLQFPTTGRCEPSRVTESDRHIAGPLSGSLDFFVGTVPTTHIDFIARTFKVDVAFESRASAGYPTNSANACGLTLHKPLNGLSVSIMTTSAKNSTEATRTKQHAPIIA